MELPKLVYALGAAGLIPFLLGPLWLQISPDTAPVWLDRMWWTYGSLIATFMAGTFWGFALPACQGLQGMIGLFIASVLMLLTWAAMALPFHASLIALAAVFLLLLLADFWRERTLDTIGGYSALRTVLTLGVIVAIGWRLLLPA